MNQEIAERRICPREFQLAIDERFGRNSFGTSNYKIAWGQTETTRVAGLHRYEDRLLCGNIPCWNILRWRPPSTFGTPALWNLVQRDKASGLCLMGEFPYEGRYDLLVDLVSKEMHNGRLLVDVFPLDYYLVDRIMPLLDKARDLTEAEIETSLAFAEEQENKAIVDMITDRMMDELPTRFGPVSYSKQGCRTAVITKKMEEISRTWNRMSKTALRRQRTGFYQGNPN